MDSPCAQSRSSDRNEYLAITRYTFDRCMFDVMVDDEKYFSIDGVVFIPTGSRVQNGRTSINSSDRMARRQRERRRKQMPVRPPPPALVDAGITVLISLVIDLIEADSMRVVCAYLTPVELAEYKERNDVIRVHPFEIEETDDPKKTARQRKKSRKKKKRTGDAKMRQLSRTFSGPSKSWWRRRWNRPGLENL